MPWPRLADVCYALIYPAVTTIIGIALGSADGVCNSSMLPKAGGRFMPVGMDVMDCGPRESIVSLGALFAQFNVLPSYWGELNILKSMGVVVGSIVMNLLYAFETELLVVVGIPLAAVWVAMKLWNRLAVCFACVMNWYKWDTHKDFDEMLMKHCNFPFRCCEDGLKVLYAIYFLLFFVVGVYWINLVRDLVIQILSLDLTIPYLIYLVVLLRKPLDSKEVTDAAGAAAVAVMLPSGAPRSDQLSA